MYLYMCMPARDIRTQTLDIAALFRDKADMSSEFSTMSGEFAVNYRDNAVHAPDLSYKYRAVIDHAKDIVAMSGNKCVLTLYKADNYIDLMIMSLYIAAMYMLDGTMYKDKMGILNRRRLGRSVYNRIWKPLSVDVITEKINSSDTVSGVDHPPQ